MDNNFQTSFIPKKPLAEERAHVVRHSSIFSFIATLLFFAALASAAAMYFYEASLTKSIAGMNTELNTARNSFEPSLISTLQKLDTRITAANELLNNHIVVSPIFAALQVNTLKSIQFTKFSYVTPADPTAPVTVTMSGIGRDYSSIALQSDQLATNPNIHNSIFSNLTLNDKTGMVSFDLTFDVDASLVRFTNDLSDFTAQPGTPASSSSGTPDASSAAPAGSSSPASATAPAAGAPAPSAPSGTAPSSASPGLEPASPSLGIGQ